MANSENIRSAICVLIEGISVSFWTDENAATAVDVGRDSYHVGLELPTSLPAGFSLTDGHLTSGRVRLKIQDVDDTLAALFAAVRSDTEYLNSEIEPGDTVANTASQTLRGRHIGTEYVGAAGERRQYPVFEGFEIGMRHPSAAEAGALGLGSTPITTQPLLWPGRRIAIYRFRELDGAWQAWSAAKLLWWGTVRGTGSTRGRFWTINADGHDSLLRKNLGFSAWSEPEEVTDAEIKFEENERTVHAVSTLVQYTDQTFRSYGRDEQTIAGNTVADVRAAFSTVVNAAADDDEVDGQFTGSDNPGASNEEPGGDIELLAGSNSLRIRIKSLAAYAREAFCRVTMSEKAWRSLGYDPAIQGDEALLNGDDPEAYVDFRVADGQFGSPSGLPYYVARFSTRPVEAILDGAAGNTYADNDGDWRAWNPIFGNAEDEVYTLYAAGRQEVYLSVQGEVAYCRGQHDMPVAEDPDSPGSAYTFSGGGSASATRLFAFYGKRRTEGVDDEFDEVWVGRCSWVDTNGAIGQQNADQDLPALYVDEWLDPALFGFPTQNTGGAAYTTDWSAPKGAIRCVPLHHLTHVADGYADNPVKLCRNLLVASGTGGGWYTDDSYTSQQFGFGGKLEPGTNNPTGLSGLRPADAEIEDLGLAIPASLVMPMQDAITLEEELDQGLASVKLTYVGRFQAEAALKGLTRPLGYCWSLRGGRYTVFDPTAPISPDDVDHVITTESYHAKEPRDGVQTQALTLHSPIDGVEFRYAQNPIEGATRQEVRLQATDAGSRYRASDVPLQIEAPGYNDSFGFGSSLLNRWRRLFDFWGRRHYVLKGVPLHMDEDIWPGDTVRWTDAALVSVDGSYGISGALGYITRRVHDPSRAVTTVDAVLVQAPPDGFRMVAPSARVRRFDTGSNTLYCDKDHRAISSGGFDWIDVVPFGEPDWSDDGGDADVEVKQYDGNTWTTAGYSSVDSVDSVANTITLTGALTGGTGYYRDRDTLVVFREHADQSAPWVLNNYAPVADDDGEVGGDANDAVDWSDT